MDHVGDTLRRFFGKQRERFRNLEAFDQACGGNNQGVTVAGNRSLFEFDREQRFLLLGPQEELINAPVDQDAQRVLGVLTNGAEGTILCPFVGKANEVHLAALGEIGNRLSGFQKGNPGRHEVLRRRGE